MPACFHVEREREGRREEGREGRRERGRDGGKEGRTEGRWAGGRDREKEGGREARGAREGGSAENRALASEAAEPIWHAPLHGFIQ